MRAIKNVTSSWNWPNLSASNCCTCPPTRPTSISSNACGNSSRRIVCTRPITTTLRSSNRPSHLVSLKLKPHTGPPSTPCFPTASRPLKNQKLCQGRVYFYYTALTAAALYENASADEQTRWRKLLTTRLDRLREWAESYPPTFADKHALVSAEIARLERRDADAMRLYEQAIQSTRENGFVQNEGTAHEVAARFYAARGAESIAYTCLRNARYCYLRWGAGGKVRQLDRLYPHLSAADGSRPTAITGSTVQQLDVASIVKASQALSTEIELPKLIERLMTIALENAGADRGLLVLQAGEDYLIQAQGQTTGDQVEVVLRQTPITRLTCPDSLLRYVIRTRESVIIG